MPSPFLFPPAGTPFEMPHFSFPNAIPYRPKCHTLATEMPGVGSADMGIRPSNPEVLDDRVQRYGWCVQGKRIMRLERMDDVFTGIYR